MAKFSVGVIACFHQLTSERGNNLRRGTIRTNRVCEEDLRIKANSKRTANLRWSWATVVIFGLMSLVVVSVISEPYFVERQRRIEASWPQVRGKGTDLRMFKQRLSGTHFPFTVYVGECEVQYKVARKNYYVWTPFGSSLADPDSQFVSDLRRSCAQSSFVVRYKPQDASEAVADRSTDSVEPPIQ